MKRYVVRSLRKGYRTRIIRAADDVAAGLAYWARYGVPLAWLKITEAV